MAFAALMKRLGFVKLGSYGLVLTEDDRIASTRPHVLEDGLGTPIVGWRDADLAAAELPRFGAVKHQPVAVPLPSLPVRAIGSIPPANSPAMAMPAISPPASKPLPGVTPFVAAPAPMPRAESSGEEQGEEDWEWVLAIARARAEAEETPVARVAAPPIAAKPAATANPRTVIPLPTSTAASVKLVDTVPLRGRNSSPTMPPPVPPRRSVTMPAIAPVVAAKKPDPVITTSHASIPPSSATAPMRAIGTSKTAPFAVVADPTRRAVVRTVPKAVPRDPDKTQVGFETPPPPDTIDEPIVADNLARIERVSASASKARIARGTDPMTKTLAAVAPVAANDDRTETNILLPPAANPVALPSVKRLARR